MAPELTEKPMVFEVFTNVEDENQALEVISRIVVQEPSIGDRIKGTIKNIVGDDIVDSIKRHF